MIIGINLMDLNSYIAILKQYNNKQLAQFRNLIHGIGYSQIGCSAGPSSVVRVL